MAKSDKVIAVTTRTVAIASLAVLAVAGAMYFLGGVDKLIAYPFAVIGVAFLLEKVI